MKTSAQVPRWELKSRVRPHTSVILQLLVRSVWGREEMAWLSEAHGPASLAELMSFRFRKRHCLEN